MRSGSACAHSGTGTSVLSETLVASAWAWADPMVVSISPARSVRRGWTESTVEAETSRSDTSERSRSALRCTTSSRRTPAGDRPSASSSTRSTLPRTDINGAAELVGDVGNQLFLGGQRFNEACDVAVDETAPLNPPSSFLIIRAAVETARCAGPSPIHTR